MQVTAWQIADGSVWIAWPADEKTGLCEVLRFDPVLGIPYSLTAEKVNALAADADAAIAATVRDASSISINPA